MRYIVFSLLLPFSLGIPPLKDECLPNLSRNIRSHQLFREAQVKVFIRLLQGLVQDQINLIAHN